MMGNILSLHLFSANSLDYYSYAKSVREMVFLLKIEDVFHLNLCAIFREMIITKNFWNSASLERRYKKFKRLCS